MITYYGYIYKTTNTINGRFYIGKRNGCYDNSYFGSGTLLKRAIAKYGLSNFETELVVYAVDKEELNQLEKFHIANNREKHGRDNMYNLSDGGDGGATRTGYKHSVATKDKLRLVHLGMTSGMKGKTMSKEARNKISMSRLGKTPFSGGKHSEEARKKISQSKLGKPLPKSTRDKMSKSWKEKYKAGYVHPMLGRTPWNKGLILGGVQND